MIYSVILININNRSERKNKIKMHGPYGQPGMQHPPQMGHQHHAMGPGMQHQPQMGHQHHMGPGMQGPGMHGHGMGHPGMNGPHH